jgi:hypothetical protein
VELLESTSVFLLTHYGAQGNQCELSNKPWKFLVISTPSCPCPCEALHPAILGFRAHCQVISEHSFEILPLTPVFVLTSGMVSRPSDPSSKYVKYASHFEDTAHNCDVWFTILRAKRGRFDSRCFSPGELASARESLRRGLGSRWFTERFHRNALITHFQHGSVL